MRSRDEVLEKFREMRDVKVREMKDRYLCTSHVNCQYNVRMKVHGKGLVGFCQNPIVLNKARTRIFVCNDDNTARRCSVYFCRNTDASVEGFFNHILKSPALCGERYPKLAMLIWFLQDADSGSRWHRFSYLVKQVWLSLYKLISCRWV